MDVFTSCILICIGVNQVTSKTWKFQVDYFQEDFYPFMQTHFDWNTSWILMGTCWHQYYAHSWSFTEVKGLSLSFLRRLLRMSNTYVFIKWKSARFGICYFVCCTLVLFCMTVNITKPEAVIAMTLKNHHNFDKYIGRADHYHFFFRVKLELFFKTFR